MLYLDHAAPVNQYSEEISIKRELSFRYFIMQVQKCSACFVATTNNHHSRAYNYVYSLKSRLDDNNVNPAPSLDPNSGNVSTEDIARLMHQWHVGEATGLSLRLRTMQLFPQFFVHETTASERGTLQNVSMTDIIKNLREMTDMFDFRSDDGSHITPRRVWDSGIPSKLLKGSIDSHISSVYGTCQLDVDENGEPGPSSSWLQLVGCGAMYLTSILHVWNRGNPPSPNILRYVLLVLRPRLQHDLDKLDELSPVNRDAWFWRVFTAASALRQKQSINSSDILHTTSSVYAKMITVWAQKCSVSSWIEAEQALRRMVWPRSPQCRKDSEAVWDWAIQQGSVAI